MCRVDRVRVIAAATLVGWLAPAAVAWANAPDPERYPEAAERYGRGMTWLLGSILGCAVLIIIAMIAVVVLIVRWLVKRADAKPADDTTAPAAPAPPAPPADGS